MLSADTRLILVNDIYFKGDWERKFDEKLTKKADFYINDTEKVQVDLMHMSSGFNYVFLQDLDASAIEMKYANSNFSFVAVQPNSRTGLHELEAKLNNYNLTAITEQMEVEQMDVWIPKFKAEFEINLNGALKTVCNSKKCNSIIFTKIHFIFLFSWEWRRFLQKMQICVVF